MTLRVGVDFGASSTCVAFSEGGEPEVIAFDGQLGFPSAVYASADGALLAGRDAQRQAVVDPSRFEPHLKHHIDEEELLLGVTVVAVIDAVRAVLRRAVGQARRAAGGGPVDLLVLTHPACWGAARTRVLRQAGHDLANELVLIPEPVAAAACHAADHEPTGRLAVLHVGGATVTASVVTRDASGGGRNPSGRLRIVAARHDSGFGGADVDDVLLAHIGTEVAGKDPAGWRTLIEGQQRADLRRRWSLRSDIRGAKENLSRRPYTDVPLPPPFPDVHVTRADFEGLIASRLDAAVALLADCLNEAGLPHGAPVPVFLTGGSSRIPLVARLVHRHTGIIPTAPPQPEAVVARGALLAASYPAFSGLTVGIRGAGLPRPGERTATPVVARPAVPPAVTVPAGPPAAPSGPPVVRTAPRIRQGSRPTGRRWLRWAAGGAAVLALVGAGLGTWLLVRPAPRISVYDYAFELPDGWQQTGGTPSLRKVQIGPPGQPGGANSITVQEFRLVDDSRQHNARQLRAQLVAHGGFSLIDTDTRYAGRTVMSYQEQRPTPPAATIRWYVLFSGHVQVSVGCESTPARTDQVRAACERVVGTMMIRQ